MRPSGRMCFTRDDKDNAGIGRPWPDNWIRKAFAGLVRPRVAFVPFGKHSAALAAPGVSWSWCVAAFAAFRGVHGRGMMSVAQRVAARAIRERRLP